MFSLSLQTAYWFVSSFFGVVETAKAFGGVGREFGFDKSPGVC